MPLCVSVSLCLCVSVVQQFKVDTASRQSSAPLCVSAPSAVQQFTQRAYREKSLLKIGSTRVPLGLLFAMLSSPTCTPRRSFA